MFYNNIYASREEIMKREEIVHSDEVKLAIYLKINQLKREQLHSLSYTHVLNVLFFYIWNKKLPNSIHKAIDDIMNLNANDVIVALHTLAMVEGSKMEVDRIDDLLGGKV